ncbi:MAG: type II secretion system protein GspF, partial [Deltaproteobacteria bacterium]|nr:type II secretion system protein GspF [Deltaproteobacteria bacterium]
MPTYRYKGISRAGQSLKGTVEAENPVQARKKLHGDGVFPEKLAEDAGGRGAISLPSLLGRQEFLPLFTRQLATLSGAGVPLVGALKS